MKILLGFFLGTLSLNILANSIDIGQLAETIKANQGNQKVMSQIYYNDLAEVEEAIVTGAGASYTGTKRIENIECNTDIDMNNYGVIENINCKTK